MGSWPLNTACPALGARKNSELWDSGAPGVLPALAQGRILCPEQGRGPAAPAPPTLVAGKGHPPGPIRSPGRAQANTAEFCQ